MPARRPSSTTANPCTADSCDPATGVAHDPLAAGTSCADGDLCNGDETCDGAGACVAGIAPVLDDGNPCTADSCDPATGVSNDPVAAGTSCADGDLCNGDELCSAAGDCLPGDPLVVDDGNPCTDDSCDPVAGVANTPLAAGTSCADADLCNGDELCDALATCQSGTPLDPDDGNACTADSCDPIAGVVNTPVAAGTSCADADLCNGDELCDGAGTCAAGTAPDLDDANPCTADSCDPTTGVAHTPVAPGTSCADADLCNGDETCNGAGSCVAGTAPDLDDANPCTADSCDPATGVAHDPLAAGTSCADADLCNGDETCNDAGSCDTGTAPDLDDANPCTADSCDPVTGVTHTPVAAGTSCADGDLCNGEETCNGAGDCLPGNPLATDDENPCTEDFCDPVTGVVNTPLAAGTSCGDADVCNGEELCDSLATCQPGSPLEVNDGNACTEDACDPANGVAHTPVAAGTSCADANLCNGDEVCDASGSCQSGTLLDVNDGNPCTADSCDAATGATHEPATAGTSCADADLCDGAETCNGAGDCQDGSPIDVNDGDPCTADVCEPATGQIFHPPQPAGTTCADEDLCNGTEICDAAGQCQPGTPPNLDDGDPATVDTCEPDRGPVHRLTPVPDPTVETTVASGAEWLVGGPDPVQVGVAPGTIEQRRATILHGNVLNSSGDPLPGVAIRVAHHPELGSTLSQAQGTFDMAINGGGRMTLIYQKEGYLEAQRAVETGWSEQPFASDVVMLRSDPNVTEVNLTSSAPIQVARGSVIDDGDGLRQATLLFPAGTEATMVLEDGSTEPLDVMHIRITEFTEGALGESAMPAELPPTTQFTYAIEVNADEAIEAGAQHVTLSNPLPLYLENFLEFPVGTGIPKGVYDRGKSAWLPEENGQVVENRRHRRRRRRAGPGRRRRRRTQHRPGSHRYHPRRAHEPRRAVLPRPATVAGGAAPLH